jgi:hypothetical protein
MVDKLRPLSFRGHLSIVLQRQREMKKNWGKFARWLRTETREYDKYQVTTRPSQLPNSHSAKGKQESSSNRTSCGSPTDHTSGRKTKKGRRKKSHDNSKNKEQAPLCRNNSTCPNERHFVLDCSNSSKEERETILAKYRENKSSTRRQTFRTG